MCTENAMQISLKGDTFQSLKEDFDIILDRTLGNMHMKGAEDAVISLKLSVSLVKANAMVQGNCTSITRPSFKHEISSVMQVKDKKTGALTGDYQLVWDEDEGKFVMKKIEDGQTNIFEEEGNNDGIEAEYSECVTPELAAPKDETSEDSFEDEEGIITAEEELENIETDSFDYDEPDENV